MSERETINTPSDRAIRVERVFEAPRERVWLAMTEPALVAQWWGRANRIVVERMEVERGGHWRFVEHAPDGRHVFGGRYREVTPPERMVQTFEWEGMPGHVAVETTTLVDLGNGRTKVITESLFHTREERDAMLESGMAEGLRQSYAALDALLEKEPMAASRANRRRGVRRVAFVVYPVTDVERARAFYEHALGLQPGMAGGQGDKHWVEYDLPGGGCLALTNTTGAQPSHEAGGTIALEVDDIEALKASLETEGVQFQGDVIRGPRCRMAVCLDSEGNALLLHQLDEPS